MAIKKTYEALFGAAYLRWSSIEWLLYLIFQEGFDEDYAWDIWGTLWHITPQYNLLNKIMEREFKRHDASLKIWQALSGRIKRAIKDRNKLAHGSYDKYYTEGRLRPGIVPNIFSDKEGIPEIIKKEQLIAMAKRYEHLERDLEEFYLSTILKWEKP